MATGCRSGMKRLRARRPGAIWRTDASAPRCAVAASSPKPASCPARTTQPDPIQTETMGSDPIARGKPAMTNANQAGETAVPPLTPAPEDTLAWRDKRTLPPRLRDMLALEDFETVARRRLPRPIYGYVSGGVETNASL